ncbi:MAG: hypothetical protein ACM3YN_14555 [Parcubacteria group bacterium]
MRVLAALAALVVCACTTVDPNPPEHATSHAISERNYVIGQTLTAAVGDTLIRVREYVVQERPITAVRANSDFRVKGGGYDIAFSKDQVVPVAGTLVEGPTTYYVVPIETTQLGLAGTLSLKVDSEGVIARKALDGGFIYSYRTIPESGRLAPVRETEVARSKPFSNYELLFNGSDGQTLRLTYREYSPDDLARTAFFQELTYPAQTRVIRFRRLVLDVTHLDEQSISYVVRAD